MSDWSGAVDGLLTACRDTFGQSILYQPKVGEAVEVVGVFRRDLESVTLDAADVPVITRRTELTLLRRDTPLTPAIGDLVTVAGLDYRVDQVEEREHGEIRLTLNRV